MREIINACWNCTREQMHLSRGPVQVTSLDSQPAYAPFTDFPVRPVARRQVADERLDKALQTPRQAVELNKNHAGHGAQPRQHVLGPLA